MPSPLPRCISLNSTPFRATITVGIGHPGILNVVSGFSTALGRSGTKPLSIVIVHRHGSPQNTAILEAVTMNSITKLLDEEWTRVRSLVAHTYLRSSLAPALDLVERRCQRNIGDIKLSYEVDDSDDEDD
ncbi:hypothetical protein NMY22_g14270 [Coprinellus aureogranulatus]|nr:hypothetical protein NMY22_g14270 [Coprinellus aureogranulatus]